jgi:hypothetical protein
MKNPRGEHDRTLADVKPDSLYENRRFALCCVAYVLKLGLTGFIVGMTKSRDVHRPMPFV